MSTTLIHKHDQDPRNRQKTDLPEYPHEVDDAAFGITADDILDASKRRPRRHKYAGSSQSKV